jgi:hypothetical protein
MALGSGPPLSFKSRCQRPGSTWGKYFIVISFRIHSEFIAFWLSCKGWDDGERERRWLLAKGVIIRFASLPAVTVLSKMNPRREDLYRCIEFFSNRCSRGCLCG